MWTRKELKEKGKVAFKRNYWLCVLAAFIMTVLAGASGSAGKTGSGESQYDELMAAINGASMQSGVSVGAIIGILAGIMGVAVLIALVINVFAKNPLLVGINRFFVVNTKEQAKIKEIIYSFSNGRYLKTVGTVFLRDLFIGLWSLLLVIPGIIKAYQYRMVSYILADDPEISMMDALRKSKEMMKGHKWNTFVLDLSFIGWGLLGCITLGIVNIFYVNPYVQATNAELYLELKK